LLQPGTRTKLSVRNATDGFVNNSLAEITARAMYSCVAKTKKYNHLDSSTTLTSLCVDVIIDKNGE